MGQLGFCKNLQFSAKICVSEMLQFPEKRRSAKICEICKKNKTANLAPFVPFSLSLLFSLDIAPADVILANCPTLEIEIAVAQRTRPY